MFYILTLSIEGIKRNLKIIEVISNKIRQLYKRLYICRRNRERDKTFNMEL
jgi:hypothetical protein